MIIRRLLFALAILPIMLVMIAGGAWFWLLYSESGARWAWSQAEIATDGALAAASISGALTPGVQIKGLEYRGGAIAVSIDAAELQVHVDVFPLAVEIGPARATGARIEFSDDGNTATDAPDRDVELPVPVSVSNLEILDLAIEGVSDDGDLLVNSASLSGTLETYALVASGTGPEISSHSPRPESRLAARLAN
jgi:hypothetical protein